MVSFIASLVTAVLAAHAATATSTPTVGPQHCHAAGEFGNHADVLARVQQFGASMACRKKGGPISSGDSPLPWFVTGANVQPGYHYEISWVDGCEGESQNSLTPVEGATCDDLLIGSWKNCNNDGAGGWIDAGCVRYKFWPSS
ncbi:hypothetical protein FE257_007982 [Aspergillus nanangensis]|uniref:Uncharacterized protein n=1 Tax=Aspergillus nanangensis TaxID=2582783 RepID=A0AAD4CM18_ASPNN|nr:hypothetical protein FE257_007982 [Aspergillus nanangensis]